MQNVNINYINGVKYHLVNRVGLSKNYAGENGGVEIVIKMTVAEALQIAIPQDIELTDLKEAEKKLGIKQTPRTKEEKMAEVNAILRMTAKNKGCKVPDLEWKRDRSGNIFVRRKNVESI